VDANAGVRWKNIEAALDVQNLFDARWREVQFANQSRLPFEPAPVTGIHYTPGWPRTVMGRATLYWQ
jgi:outer membrane receptor protein involved in Fe transport